MHAQDFDLDEVYSIDSKGTLELHSDDANVTIIGSNRNDVHVEIHRKINAKGFTLGSEDFRVEIDEENGNLNIIERHEQSNITFMGYVEENYKILIEAPSSISLNIYGDDDDYKITNIDGSISLNIDDGDANLSGCNGKNFDFDIDDGNITMDVAGGRLKARIDDGELEIKKGDLTDIDVVADDAEIYITTAIVDVGSYYMRGDDCTFDFFVYEGGGTIEVLHDDGRVTYDDNFELIDKEDGEVTLRLGGGNAKVRFRGDDFRVNLGAGRHN